MYIRTVGGDWCRSEMSGRDGAKIRYSLGGDRYISIPVAPRQPDKDSEMSVLKAWWKSHKKEAYVVAYQGNPWMCTEKDGTLYLVRWSLEVNNTRVTEHRFSFNGCDMGHLPKGVVECWTFYENGTETVGGQQLIRVTAEFKGRAEQGPAKKAKTDGMEAVVRELSPAAGGARGVLSAEGEKYDNYEMSGYKPQPPDDHTDPNSLGCNWRPLPEDQSPQ